MDTRGTPSRTPSRTTNRASRPVVSNIMTDAPAPTGAIPVTTPGEVVLDLEGDVERTAPAEHIAPADRPTTTERPATPPVSRTEPNPFFPRADARRPAPQAQNFNLLTTVANYISGLFGRSTTPEATRVHTHRNPSYGTVASRAPRGTELPGLSHLQVPLNPGETPAGASGPVQAWGETHSQPSSRIAQARQAATRNPLQLVLWLLVIGLIAWIATLQRALSQANSQLLAVNSYGSRMDALNNQFLRLNDTVSNYDAAIADALSQSGQAVTTADQAMLTAINANMTAYGIADTALAALDTAEDAENTANTAMLTATEANRTANGIAGTAQQALDAAEDATGTASTAILTATQANITANGIAGTALDAKTTANVALVTAQTASESVADLTGRVGALQANISALQDANTQFATEIDALQVADEEFDEEITTLTSNITGIGSDVTAVNSRVSGLEAGFTGLEDSITGIQTNVSTVATQAAQAIANAQNLTAVVSSLLSTVDGLTEESAAISSSLLALNDSLADVSGRVSNVEVRTTTLEGVTVAQQGEIDTLNSEFSALNATVNYLMQAINGSSPNPSPSPSPSPAPQGGIAIPGTETWPADGSATQTITSVTINFSTAESGSYRIVFVYGPNGFSLCSPLNGSPNSEQGTSTFMSTGDLLTSTIYSARSSMKFGAACTVQLAITTPDGIVYQSNVMNAQPSQMLTEAAKASPSSTPFNRFLRGSPSSATPAPTIKFEELAP